MEYNIRLAKIEDCKAISKVKRKVWETTYRGIYPDEKIDSYNYKEQEEMFKSLVINKDIDLYVVEVNNEIVGYMDCGVPIRQFEDYEQEIGLFYILEEFQRKGIGRELFKIAYENIKGKGYDRFFISCNKYNLPAQRFYEKMGGKIVHIDEDNENKSIPQIKYHYDIKI